MTAAASIGLLSANQVELPEVGAEQRSHEIQQGLRGIAKKNWSLWIFAVIVILSLTGVVSTLSLSVISEPSEPFYAFHISQSVRGLVGLILVFSVYTLYQQVQLRRTRERLAQQVEIAAREQIRAEEFMKLAMVDSLTGLHNRRFAEERLSAEISRATRSGSSLTVMMLDLDNLKRVNDRYGHPGGDCALKKFAERLAGAIRGSDLAARVGGDEFVVLLPECNHRQIHGVLSRLTPLDFKIDEENIPLGF
jgi:diguanylate cyclase (GGDEF)-like protein